MRSKVITIGMVLAFCVAVWLCNSAINSIKEREGIAETSPFKELPPGEFAGTLLLGGFRAIAVDILWLRATELREEREWYQLMALYELIAHLQPHFEEVWVFNAWNLAFNIPYYVDEPEERWRWVKKALEFLDDGLGRNPRSAKLMFMKGWIFDFRIPQERYLERRVKEEFGKDCYELAVEWYARAVSEEKHTRQHELSYYQGLRKLGQRREIEGKLDEAISTWRRAQEYAVGEMAIVLWQEHYLWLEAIIEGLEWQKRAIEAEKRGEAEVRVGRLFMKYLANSDLTLETIVTCNPTFASERREYAALKAFGHLWDAACGAISAGDLGEGVSLATVALGALARGLSEPAVHEPDEEFCELMKGALARLENTDRVLKCLTADAVAGASLPVNHGQDAHATAEWVLPRLGFELTYRLMVQKEEMERHRDALEHLRKARIFLEANLKSRRAAEYLDGLGFSMEVEALASESLARGDLRRARRYYQRALEQFRVLSANYPNDYLAFSRFISLKERLRRKELKQ